jgi:hypothetical protein
MVMVGCVLLLGVGLNSQLIEKKIILHLRLVNNKILLNWIKF